MRVAAQAPLNVDPTTTKAQADAAFDTRNYERALDAYRAAFAAGGDARLHYNIAQTLTALGRYPEALESYQRFLAEAPAGTLSTAQQEKFFQLLDELKAKISRLEIVCDVAGARVFVRDKALGTTPLSAPLTLDAGGAKIEILAEGYEPFVANVDLPGAGAKKVDATLRRVDFTGSLAVHGNVAAHVVVDGHDRGETPVTVRLDRGAHTVVVRAEGYVEQTKTIELAAGAKDEATFALRRSPDYTIAFAGFGLGGAALATGAVMGILAFTSFDSAKNQCDQVDQQCGPSAQAAMATSRTYGIISDVTLAIGAVGVGVGIVGLFTADHDRKSERPLKLVVLPTGLGIRGAF
jgi:tetratricopeptide (TPR) repeat protein